MKNKNMKLIISFMFLIIFVGVSGNLIGNNYSYSITEDESSLYFKNLSLISDKHVRYDEKVYVELDAVVSEINDIEVELYNKKNNKRFSAKVESLDNKPYITITKRDKNIINGYTYELDLIHVTFKNKDYITYSSGYKSGLYVSLEGKSTGSITIEERYYDSIWRDFVDVRIPLNTLARLYDNTYVTLHADTKDIVNISLEFTDETETESFITYLENIDTRPYFRLSDNDGNVGYKYNLKTVEVFYVDGEHVSYNTYDDKTNTPWISIGDERSITIVENTIDYAPYRAVEDIESTSKATDLEEVDKNYSSTLAEVITVILILLVAVGIFVFLKDEDR